MLYPFTRAIDKIKDGTKPHTLRRLSKRKPPKVGQLLHLYEHMRKPDMQLIIEPIKCVGVQPAEIRMTWEGDKDTGHLSGYITLNGVVLTPLQVLRLIWNDGFRIGPKSDQRTFFDFFALPSMQSIEFDGYLVSWAPHSLLCVGEPSAHCDWLSTLERPGRIRQIMPRISAAESMLVHAAQLRAGGGQ